MSQFILLCLLSCCVSSFAWNLSSQCKRSSTALFSQIRNNDQVDFMEKDPGSSVGDFPALDGTFPDLTDDIGLVKTIARAADGRKAEDVVALQVAQVSTMCSFLVICSGNSRPQNQAITAAISEEVSEEWGIDENPQGTADSGWIVLDYGSVMVHVMTPKSRLYYNIEGQWLQKGGTNVDLSDVLVPNKLEEFGGDTMEGLSAQDDPFWS